ncbi:MAG: hypothetical protein KatS3mg081_1850 [Gemmatimonadales bacterium]|nr:MAG: hypothetical protein KatS3mg081_1850 [Gemmatimonadales bacterium]
MPNRHAAKPFATLRVGAVLALTLGPLASLESQTIPASNTIPGVSGICATRPIVTGAPADPTQNTGPRRAGSAVGAAAADLLCMDLLPTPSATTARGVIELGRPHSPFGVAVTREGHQRYTLTAWIAGLPDPQALGGNHYIAWATTPVLDPVVKLGPVTNGRNALGEVSFDKFLILISAEADSATNERHGPLVLRGRAPSMLMEGHDPTARAPAAVAAEPDDDEHHTRVWPMPPMYPGLTMLPGLMRLAPQVTPLALDTLAPASAPPARPGRVVRLENGGTLDLEAGLVTRQIAGRTVTMLAFNGQHPGPLIAVRESTTIFVNFMNRTPFPTAIHWHGVRLDNRFDGVPHVTQEPVLPGRTFRYQIFFPDAGIYWYHPHHREDVQQELGLYGNMLVEPRRPVYGNPVNREEPLILDDLLLDERGIVPFGSEGANYALMGRFGNVFLVNGEPDWRTQVKRGEVVRFYLTNAANTRTMNVSFDPQLPIKLVGSDVGRFEREEWVESVVLGPAERYIVEVRFPEEGVYRLMNRVRAIDHRTGVFFPEETVMGAIAVSPEAAAPDHGDAFERLREYPDVMAEIARYRPHFDRPPEKELILSIEVDSLPAAMEQVMMWDWVYFHPVEWAGTMPDMNFASTPREVRWVLRDPRSGLENDAIEWRFRVGEVIKIRVYNDRHGFHAMQHPLHIHGQRFLVLSQNGVPNRNLVWKDTVLLPTGSTTDLLLEISNPGRWMVHCHIAEHLEAGMRFVMEVEEGR